MIWRHAVRQSRVAVNQIGANLNPKRMFIAQRLSMQRLGAVKSQYIA